MYHCHDVSSEPIPFVQLEKRDERQTHNIVHPIIEQRSTILDKSNAAIWCYSQFHTSTYYCEIENIVESDTDGLLWQFHISHKVLERTVGLRVVLTSIASTVWSSKLYIAYLGSLNPFPISKVFVLSPSSVTLTSSGEIVSNGRFSSEKREDLKGNGRRATSSVLADRK